MNIEGRNGEGRNGEKLQIASSIFHIHINLKTRASEIIISTLTALNTKSSALGTGHSALIIII
jgi:hypothetical protein